MEKFAYAAAGFLAGAVLSAVFTMRYMEEDFAKQQRVMMFLHGDKRASACQLPEAQRPKNLDCRGLSP